jgi:hypothetical protein
LFSVFLFLFFDAALQMMRLSQWLKNGTGRNGINGIFSETERNETDNI